MFGLGFSPPSPMLQSAVLIAVTVGVLVVSCLCWPSAGQKLQQELMWVVAPREAERSRIRRLILPTEVSRALSCRPLCPLAALVAR